LVSIEAIKALRERTGAGVMECKSALMEAKGNLDAAEAILKKRGLFLVERRAGRSTGEGLIEAYVHPGGRIGALIEVNCETDFVARTEEFKELAHNLAMQVAAMNPKFLSLDEVPPGENPDEACLLSQLFIKEPQKSVQDIITEAKVKLGENIEVGRFVRFRIGD
jgi:elongation factor Ts